MATKLPKTVQELIERFENNKKDYKNPSYKEFRLRREFIDPFFDALEWDVGNVAGDAEPYKDVVVEDSIKIDGASKAPDYAFRIGGTRKFFVETKAPSTGIKDNEEAAFQLRRYGWSAKLPISILTNFEEFAVYDCRIRPTASDKASKGRILFFTCEEYSDRWSDLAQTFSKTAVKKGAFDRFATDATTKRGTAEVDATFLAEIEEWRSSLARNIALRNPSLTVRELNSGVQRTIDRIIFLRICEDRGIEPYGRLQALVKGKEIYAELCKLFRQADGRYNSGLFHFDAGDRSAETLDTFTLKLSIDDKILKDILNGLYYPESPYAFQVFPADILGQVYEQFLGKVIRLAGKSAIVEEKPEVKKAGGVYYTPTFVVRYIVQSVLKPLLHGKTPDQIAGSKSSSGKKSPLRILDPACGSGSFLIEAFQHLMNWHLEYYLSSKPEKYSKGKAPKLFRGIRGKWQLAIAEKRRILLTHIFGVDIDPQAVEVTKLSLLLKVLEDESADLVASQMSLFHTRALPDLGNNIKCGNSLVSADFYEAAQAGLFQDDEKVKINAFDWPDEFDFNFDCVIGNPPYGADYTEMEKHYFQSKYQYKKGKPETYLFFLEQGLALLRDDGMLGYIVPNAWLTNFYGKQIRERVLAETTIREVVDLEPVRIFRGATVDTCIIVLDKHASQKSHRTSVSRINSDRDILPAFSVHQAQWAKERSKIIGVYASEADLLIMQKMESGDLVLTDVVEFSQGVIPYKTKADGLKNLHISSTARNPSWKPLLESADQVTPYSVSAPKAYVHYGRWLWCAREPKYFEKPKILFHRLRKKLPRQLVAAIDTEQLVNRHSLSNMILLPGRKDDELWAILAVFNSALCNWWFVTKYGPLMEVGGFKIESIPLPPDWATHWPTLASKAKEVTSSASKAMAAKGTESRSIHDRAERSARRAIENYLAKAYGLSAAEISYTQTQAQKLVDRSTERGDE